MDNVSKCAKCSGNLTKGFVVDKGHLDYGQKSLWAEAITDGLLGGEPVKAKIIEAYRCDNCGFLEIYANETAKSVDFFELSLPTCPKCKRKYSESISECPYCNLKLNRK